MGFSGVGFSGVGFSGVGFSGVGFSGVDFLQWNSLECVVAERVFMGKSLSFKPLIAKLIYLSLNSPWLSGLLSHCLKESTRCPYLNGSTVKVTEFKCPQ